MYKGKNRIALHKCSLEAISFFHRKRSDFQPKYPNKNTSLHNRGHNNI